MVRCMQRTNIYLETRQTEALDRLASFEGVSRAEIIRRIIDLSLGNRDDRASALAAIESTFGAASDIQGLSREPGAREAHLERMWDAS